MVIWLFSSYTTGTSPQHHSSRDGRVLWVCYHATATPGNGSAVFLPQGFADNDFGKENPRGNASALTASLFLKVPQDPTKSTLVSYNSLEGTLKII